MESILFVKTSTEQWKFVRIAIKLSQPGTFIQETCQKNVIKSFVIDVIIL